MVVCLGPKGSNFILGGKLTHVSAEDAYSVGSRHIDSFVMTANLSSSFYFCHPQHLTTPVFGKGVVFDCPNHVLMEQKRFVKFGLTTENFRAYVGMIEDEVEDLLSPDSAFSLDQRKEKSTWGQFNSTKTLAELTILTASRTLQGQEVRDGLDKSFAQIYNDLDGGFTPLNFMFPNLPLPSYWKRDAAQKKMSDFYMEIIQKRKSENHEVSIKG